MANIRKWLNKGLSQLSKLRVGSTLWVTLTATFLLFGSILLYIGTWIWLMFFMKLTTLHELREIIVILCGAPLIAAVSTLRLGLVDKDKNGIADIDEKKGGERNV